MAQASIKKDRYNSAWEFLMGLYVAHNLVLYMRTQQGDPSAENALKGSIPTGIASSKSVDGLSISYEFMGLQEDFIGYGTWKLTTYGQQLITLTKAYGHAGMWVNGTCSNSLLYFNSQWQYFNSIKLVYDIAKPIASTYRLPLDNSGIDRQALQSGGIRIEVSIIE